MNDGRTWGESRKQPDRCLWCRGGPPDLRATPGGLAMHPACVPAAEASGVWAGPIVLVRGLDGEGRRGTQGDLFGGLAS